MGEWKKHIDKINQRGITVDLTNKKVSPVAADYIFGIDPGVETGIAVWGCQEQQLIQVECMPLHKAIEKITNWAGMKIFIRLEDARKRNWFGESGREQLQGAGSIKRDCKIWEDFLTDHKIPFELVAPKNNKTKVNADLFEKTTGWKKKTNEHARDAAMLVYGFNCKHIININKGLSVPVVMHTSQGLNKKV